MSTPGHNTDDHDGDIAQRAAPARSRFSIEFPSAIDKQLEEMAAEKGVTKTEMVRMAVRAMAQIHELEKDGYRNASMRTAEDGVREAVRILF